MRSHAIGALLLLALVAASGSGCSSDTPAANGPAGAGGASGSGSGSGGASGSGGSSSLEGTFTVRLQPADEATMTPAFTVVSGKAYDGPVPPILVLVPAREEGACRLMKPKVPFCDGGCGGSAVCVDDGVCVPYPKAQNVGVVTVEGLGASDVTMDPFPPSFAYESMALPNPPCGEGADIRLKAESFAMLAPCIAPLELTGTLPISVRRDQPVRIAWKAPALGDIARVELLLDISHHGGKKGEIDCEVPDTGTFDIPASLVTELVDLGLAGFPTIQIARAAFAVAAASPKVKLRVASPIETEVDTGIKSCTTDDNCPAGQHCDLNNLTCK